MNSNRLQQRTNTLAALLAAAGMALLIGAAITVAGHLLAEPAVSTAAPTEQAQTDHSARSEPDTSKPSSSGRVVIPSYPRALHVGDIEPTKKPGKFAVRPVDFQRPITGVDCADGRCGPGEARWEDRRPVPFGGYQQGEYVGPHRPPHVREYRLRVDDEIEFVYRLTRNISPEPYELNVGDQIRVESLTDENIDRDLIIQPDGSITLRLLGQVRAAGRTVDQLRSHLEEKYKKFYKVPAITVTPLQVNTKLEDLRATVDAREGQGGQSRSARVTPEGTVQLPAIGSVPAQGLTLDELKREVDERYRAEVEGIEVTPVLLSRAPRFIYVIGEVRVPGRYDLTGPTTVMQAIALAGGWNNGGNLRQVVVFRRGEDWRLMATKLDLQGALLGKRPSPADEIWLRDSDIVVVPKSPILLAADFVELVFTRGIYGVVPFQGISINMSKLSTI